MARIGDGRRPTFCPRHHKLTFLTENEARLQLVRAQALRAQGEWDKIEKRYYPCELGGFHLTSWEDKAGPV